MRYRRRSESAIWAAISRAEEFRAIRGKPDLSRTWPFGLGGPRWWVAAGAALASMALLSVLDGAISTWTQGWPQPLRQVLARITQFGESDWILYPSLALFALSAVAMLFAGRGLARLALGELASLFGFIFAGVGLPSLVSSLAKGLIGRARPSHFDQFGNLYFQPSITDWTLQSFPSGHTTTAFALAAVLSFLSPLWFAPALAAAAVIGLSRIALGVHYPTDVLGGIILGVLGAYFMRWLFARGRKLFAPLPGGRIRLRRFPALRRLPALRRRGSAPAPR